MYSSKKKKKSKPMFFKDLLHKNFIPLWFNFPHHVFCAKLSSFLLPHVIHFTVLLKNNFIYLLWAMLGHRCYVVFFSSGSKQRLLSSYAQASHCGGFSCFRAWVLGCMGFHSCSHGFRSCVPGIWSTSSVAVANGLRCSKACGTFPDQRLSPCLLHWQADSLPLSLQGSVMNAFLHPLHACSTPHNMYRHSTFFFYYFCFKWLSFK